MEKDSILKDRIKFFNSLGINLGDNYDLYENSEECKKLVPSPDLVDEIETEIFCNEDKEVGSDTIGELIMDKLKDLDPVAYVRFASVYREFKDVNTFMDELKKMLN